MVIDAIEECHKAGLVPFLAGQPGVGKSSMVKQIAEKRGVPMIDFRPALHGIEDLIGLPTFNDDKTISSFATPSWLPQDGEGIFFIDELPQALPGMMAALSQFILDRSIAGYTLPDGWDIVVAGNRLQDRAATHKMPSHINDRLTFIDVEFSIEDFSAWCFSTGVPDVVRAFVKFRPEVVQKFDPAKEINCTPRSLVMASKFLDAKDSIRFALMQGTIGEGPTAEFLGYLKIWQELPDLESIVKDPKRARVPSIDRPDILYGVTTMLSSRATPENFAAMAKYIERIPQEYGVAFMKEAIRIHEELAETDTFIEYLKNNKAVLI